MLITIQHFHSHRNDQPVLYLLSHVGQVNWEVSWNCSCMCAYDGDAKWCSIM